MYIYSLVNTSWNREPYYFRMICLAEDEAEARAMHPDEQHEIDRHEAWDANQGSSRTWCEPEECDVVCLGIAYPSLEIPHVLAATWVALPDGPVTVAIDEASHG